MPVELLGRVFAAAPLGACVLDESGRITWCNAKVPEMLAQSDEPLGVPTTVSRMFGDFLTREGKDALQTVLAELRDGLRENARLLPQTRRKDGLDVRLRITMVGMGHGDPAAAAFCMVEELSRSDPMAKQAGNALAKRDNQGAFVTDIDTDIDTEIRSPMSAVVGLSTLLLQTDLDGEQRQFVEALRTSGDSMLALIDDVLDLTQLRTGKLELQHDDFDLEALIARVADELSWRTRGDVELVVSHAHSNIGSLHGDALRLRQIVTSLVANAIQFTHSGHILIRAKVEESDAQQVQFRISVEDTGVGVAAHEAKDLFGRYQRGSGTVLHGGAGLGLAITRELTALMGGKVGAMSQPGTGSTFWVRLTMPCGTSASQVIDPRALQSTRVLIAERSEARRHAFQQTLGRYGAHVNTCTSARNAIEALLQARAFEMPFDILLVGDKLEDMNGDALARVVNADGGMGEMAMIKLVPIGAQVDDTRLAKRGFSAALRQPVHQRALVQLLAEVPKQPALPAAKMPPPPLMMRAKTPRVLVVDDNQRSGVMTSQLLEQLGCRVELADGGREAVLRMTAEDFDLVLLDDDVSGLPELEAAAARRRREGSASHMPIVTLKSHGGGKHRLAPPSLPSGLPARQAPQRSKALVNLIERFTATNRSRRVSSAH
jgi:signal transduction histidine kinase/DNA-binding response OmpR family regulator